uniref:Uncharacterized protein n=1 Tax=Anguilla anguilla TaxID=7936 RepID=A0A0E9XSG5_ANGAN
MGFGDNGRNGSAVNGVVSSPKLLVLPK